MSKKVKENLEKKPTVFMNIRTDYGFKRIFADPRNKRILLDMLNAFLSGYMEEITDIELMNTEQLGIDKDSKRMSFDLYGKEANKCRFLIEMQRGMLTFFIRRSLAYMSRAVSNSIQKGDYEYKMPWMVSLNFLDYYDPFLFKHDKFMQRVMLKNDENEIFYGEMMYLFVNLCMFADGKGKDCLDERKYKWAYYLKNMEELTEEDVKGETGIFKEFIDLCRLENLNKNEMEEYKKSILDYCDVQDAIKCARIDAYAEGLDEGMDAGRLEGHLAGLDEGLKTGIEEGRKTGLEEGRQKGLAEGHEKGLVEGLEKGLAEGREKGLVEGREKGLVEGREEGESTAKRTMALEMLKKGIPLSLVSDITGLSEKEVRQLTVDFGLQDYRMRG